MKLVEQVKAKFEQVWRRETPETIVLSPYQINRILRFTSDKDNQEKFSVFNGFLTEEEKKKLDDYISQSTFQDHKFRCNKKGILPYLLESLQVEKNLKRKILDYCGLYVITAADIPTIQSGQFEEFPLPVALALSTFGKNLRRQLLAFLRQQGVMTVFYFKRPPSFYLEAIEDFPQTMTVKEKILAVLSGKHQRSLEEASHQFISVDFIPPNPIEEKDEPGNPLHLRIFVNKRLDEKFEERYASILLLKEFLTNQMNEVVISLITMIGIGSFFYYLDQMAKGNFSNEVYQGFQALVKIITHFISNLINFYSQYKLILEGDNFFEQFKSLIKKFGWYEGFIFVSGILIDLMSELIGHYNTRAGSVIFGLEPVSGSVATTISFASKIEELKKILENPAIFAMNIASLGTLGLSMTFLGGDLFHNSIAVALIGGFSEPAIAAFLTNFFLRMKIRGEVRRIREETSKKKGRVSQAKNQNKE